MAEIGDNSQFAAQERLALILSFARRIGDVKQEIKDLQADIRSIMGEGKVAGFKAKHIRLALQMLDSEKEKVLVEDMQMMHSLMRALNIEAGYQLELFEDRRPLEDRAEQQGWADSAGGKSLNNPYTSEPEASRYAKGWHANQEEARNALQRNMEETNRKLAEEEAKKSKSGGGETPTQEMIEAASGNVVAMKPARKSNSQKAKEAAKKEAEPAA